MILLLGFMKILQQLFKHSCHNGFIFVFLYRPGDSFFFKRRIPGLSRDNVHVRSFLFEDLLKTRLFTEFPR